MRVQRASDVPAVLAALAAGELALVPTETVYGVVARLDRPAAVERLFVAKGRPADRPLQVLVADVAQARALTEAWPPGAEGLATLWPGPLTMALGAVAGLPPGVTAPDGTVGLRCPDHPVLTAILQATGPLAASSANRSGEPPATTWAAAVAALGDEAAVAVDGGPSREGVASTVVAWRGGEWVVLREGVISGAEVAARGGS